VKKKGKKQCNNRLVDANIDFKNKYDRLVDWSTLSSFIALNVA